MPMNISNWTGLRSPIPNRCNLIDINSESSMSASNSNSAISKTPTSITLAGGDSIKDEFLNANQMCGSTKLSNCLTIPSGYKCNTELFKRIHLVWHLPWAIVRCILGNTSDTHSEVDVQQFSISEASIELKQWNYSNSDLSLQSLKSIASLESQCEDDTLEFMKRFVDILFENCAQLTLELKSEFGLKSRVKHSFLYSFI